MVAHYFFPKRYNFEDIGKISRWKKGYVVWEFPFWRWFLAQGGQITFWDDIDYRLWVQSGFGALESVMPKSEYEYFKKNTYQPDLLTNDMQAVLEHDAAQYHFAKPTWDDLLKGHETGGLCSVVLNYAPFDREDGVKLHAVVILDINDVEVIIHNPLGKERVQARQKIGLKEFKHAWLEATETPSLCVYKMR
ncbi:MAG: hypothetical protein OXR68_03475 [Alphaproteobacteria bacterium]|nr:hypothetical protein [Alphaproteobacteria bacterium]MDD9919667.1 hypothetical protein [Alphaproteobacteria bacterium]